VLHGHCERLDRYMVNRHAWTRVSHAVLVARYKIVVSDDAHASSPSYTASCSLRHQPYGFAQMKLDSSVVAVVTPLTRSRGQHG
jgi:hypothetical protein